MENEKYSYIVENLEYYAKDKRHKDYLRLYMEEAAKAIRELTDPHVPCSDVQQTYVEAVKKMEEYLDRMVKEAAALRECALRNVNWADVGCVNSISEKIRENFKELHRYTEAKIKDINKNTKGGS